MEIRGSSFQLMYFTKWPSQLMFPLNISVSAKQFSSNFFLEFHFDSLSCREGILPVLIQEKIKICERCN